MDKLKTSILILFTFLLSTYTYALNKQEKTTNLLFVQDIYQGKFVLLDKPDNYKLIVKTRRPEVISFSNNKKVNLAGYIKPDVFIRAFNKMAAAQGANAALAITKPDMNGFNYYFLSLNKAALDKAGNLVYKVNILYQDKDNEAKMINSFKHAILFIDDICLSCIFD